MTVGVLMSPLVALLECTRGILQGTNAIASYNWLGLTQGALNVAAIWVLTATSRLTLRAAVVCWIASTAVSVIAAVKLGATKAGGLAPVDRRVLFDSLKFGGQAWLSQLTGIVNFRIGLLLTQLLLGTVSVGIYAVAVTIAEMLFYFPNALAVVTISRYASASAAEARALLKRSATWVLAVSTACAVALALVGGPVIALIFGPAYLGSAESLRILLPGVVAFTPIAVSTWYFNAHLQKPSVNLAVGGFSAVLNASLTLLWAPTYGLTGVAWAATTAYVAASLLSVVLIKRESNRAQVPAVP
jgi:O-antigen/teichoic acid export membrane protein